MRIEVPFPELSKSNQNADGVVATWFVSDGDQVSEGQLLAEVQVDKVDAEVNAPANGRIRIIAPEGSVAAQSSAIAFIE